eukprot:scaffold88358_cov71-Phaeocystis_antarctica.AAC.3
MRESACSIAASECPPFMPTSQYCHGCSALLAGSSRVSCSIRRSCSSRVAGGLEPLRGLVPPHQAIEHVPHRENSRQELGVVLWHKAVRAEVGGEGEARLHLAAGKRACVAVAFSSRDLSVCLSVSVVTPHGLEHMPPWARAAADARGERKREAEHGNHRAHRAGRAGVRAAVGAAEVGREGVRPTHKAASTKLAQTGNYALRHVFWLSPCGRSRASNSSLAHGLAFRDFDTRPQTVVPPLLAA